MRSLTSPGPRPRLLATAALAGALVVGLSACGGDEDSPDAAPAAAAGPDGVEIEGVGSVEVDDAVAELLPAEVESAGKITVATNAPYPPFIDFVEEGNTEDFTGLDYDLLQAIAARLGLEAPFEQQPFDGLVPGLKAGKSDAIVGGITDNFERQETATFVDYTASGTGILVAGGNPEGIATMEDLCGRPVSAQKGSKQVDLLAAFSEETCGSAPIEVTTFPQNTDAVQALLANKVEAVVATQVNLLDEATKLSGKAEVVEDPDHPNGYQASPNGIGFDQADADLAAAVQAALQSLMDDGTYTKILAKWEMEPIGLDEATIDAAID